MGDNIKMNKCVCCGNITANRYTDNNGKVYIVCFNCYDNLVFKDYLDKEEDNNESS